MKLNVVPARTGLLWVKLGIRTFFRQPLALAGLSLMYLAALLAVSLIPYVGVVLASLLTPAATLGLMAATAEAQTGRFPMPTVLVSAFRAGRQRARAMLVLGAIYAVGSITATQLAVLIMGDAGDFNAVSKTTLLALAFHTPLFMMFWHAPALVHWHGVTPVKSLFFSTVACLRNFGALTLYSVVWSFVTLGLVMVFGTLGLLLGGQGMVQSMLIALMPILSAMFFTSIYFTFRDSFVADDPAPAGTDTP
jgi:hypothetical protein